MLNFDKLGFIEHFVRTNQVLKKVFIQLFQKVGALRVAEPRGLSETAFSFCKAFSFVPILAKEKASNKS